MPPDQDAFPPFDGHKQAPYEGCQIGAVYILLKKDGTMFPIEKHPPGFFTFSIFFRALLTKVKGLYCIFLQQKYNCIVIKKVVLY